MGVEEIKEIEGFMCPIGDVPRPQASVPEPREPNTSDSIPRLGGGLPNKAMPQKKGGIHGFAIRLTNNKAWKAFLITSACTTGTLGLPMVILFPPGGAALLAVAVTTYALYFLTLDDGQKVPEKERPSSTDPSNVPPNNTPNSSEEDDPEVHETKIAESRELPFERELEEEEDLNPATDPLEEIAPSAWVSGASRKRGRSQTEDPLTSERGKEKRSRMGTHRTVSGEVIASHQSVHEELASAKSTADASGEYDGLAKSLDDLLEELTNGSVSVRTSAESSWPSMDNSPASRDSLLAVMQNLGTAMKDLAGMEVDGNGDDQTQMSVDRGRTINEEAQEGPPPKRRKTHPSE